jgi:hypothetical protein
MASTDAAVRRALAALSSRSFSGAWTRSTTARARTARRALRRREVVAVRREVVAVRREVVAVRREVAT